MKMFWVTFLVNKFFANKNILKILSQYFITVNRKKENIKKN